MTRIILVRHGETTWNIEGRYQGQEDTPLSERGLQQGHLLAEGLRNIPLDFAISSPLRRSYQTCQFCAELHGLEVKSDDRLLEINHGCWEGVLAADIQKKYPAQENLKRVWAPQTVYDKEAGKYMVYWSMKHGNGADIIYYAYANKDFTDLEGEPKPLFLPKNGKSCIDGDIIYKDGLYHLFYKTEGDGNGIKKATTVSLTSGQWTESGEYKQQTKEAVEGSSIFPLIGSDKYILMYDVYMKGKYQFTESTDLENFKVIDHAVSMDFHPRHGTVIPITEKELKRLYKVYGKPTGL